MAAENVRADMSFMGYFLIGMFLLAFGILGFQDAGLFGELTFDPKTGAASIQTLPLGWIMMGIFALIIAIALTIYSVFMYRTGNKSAMAIFMVFAVSLFAYQWCSIGRNIEVLLEVGDITGDIYLISSSWFIFMILAILFVILALYLLVDKAPKFLSVLALIIAIMFFFVGLAYYFVAAGDHDNIVKAMSVVFGIFALLGFFLATYIGLAYSAPKARLPLI